MQYITLLDYLLLPFTILIVYAFAYSYRERNYGPKHPYRKYFIPAFFFKIGGAVFIGIIYQYYYKGGDTFNFFYHAQVINSSFSDSPTKWINLIFHIPDETSLGYYQYISKMYWYVDNSSYTVASITALLSTLTGGTYLPTAVLFAAISFTGAWAMFRAFAQIYPTMIKQVAIATLFIPSVIIWGSGIFKDTLCYAFLGWLTYAVFQMLIKKNFKLNNILIVIVSIYITSIIKLYILMAFIPALLIWVFFIYNQKINSRALKGVLSIVLLVLVGSISYYMLTVLGEEYLGKYSIDNISQTAEVTRGWINYASGDEGSAYDLGEIGTPGQMLIKLPLAVNATLFRPYLWESRKIIVLLSALESFLFLFLTLKVIFTIGLRKIWVTITNDPTLQFCLIFTTIFAFAVGISTFNFGALSRYKIPCLPFYALAIFIIYYKNNPANRPLFKGLNI
ncbi:MAG: hypothetical protein ACK5NK_13015 [Niabella sp.]